MAELQISQAALQAQQSAFAAALGAELGARLGREITLAHSPMQNVGVLELVDSDEPILHQKLRFTEHEAFLHVVLRRRDAALIAALERRVEGDALAAAREAELDADALAALAQVMESVIDVLRRAFENAQIPPLAVDAAQTVATPQSDPTWIDDAFYVRLRHAMTVEGFGEGHLDFVFGQGQLVADGARGESVCFVTVGEDDRKQIAGLEPTLGWPVVTIEPRELAKPLDERVLDASVVVVPWEVFGRSGVELVESLARRPELANRTILVGARRPTRALLLAALRAGASTLVALPYEAAEIRRVASAAAGEAQA